jgi:hypothetical protein
VPETNKSKLEPRFAGAPTAEAIAKPSEQIPVTGSCGAVAPITFVQLLALYIDRNDRTLDQLQRRLAKLLKRIEDRSAHV